MDRQKLIVIVTLGFFWICAQTLGGCVVFPAVAIRGAAPYEGNLAQTDLPELAHREDVIDLACRLGECLGYAVSLKTDDTIILLYETSEIKEPVTGDYQSTKIFVYKVKPFTLNSAQSKDKDFERIYRKIMPSQHTETTVHLAVYDGGVYPAGVQESVNNIMEDFKTRLLFLASRSPSDKGL